MVKTLPAQKTGATESCSAELLSGRVLIRPSSPREMKLECRFVGYEDTN